MILTFYYFFQTVWNPSTLDNILSMKHEYGEMLQSKYTPQSKPLPNVQISKVNFNMWGACQAWQTCPLDLYGLNFLHFGDPVTWYVVPREYSAKLEHIAAGKTENPGKIVLIHVNILYTYF